MPGTLRVRSYLQQEAGARGRYSCSDLYGGAGDQACRFSAACWSRGVSDRRAQGAHHGPFGLLVLVFQVAQPGRRGPVARKPLSPGGRALVKPEQARAEIAERVAELPGDLHL